MWNEPGSGDGERVRGWRNRDLGNPHTVSCLCHLCHFSRSNRNRPCPLCNGTIVEQFARGEREPEHRDTGAPAPGSPNDHERVVREPPADSPLVAIHFRAYPGFGGDRHEHCPTVMGPGHLAELAAQKDAATAAHGSGEFLSRSPMSWVKAGKPTTEPVLRPSTT